ncbi:hypothetical protein Cpir12675_005728 [Ceratocystis pirilliformis]|uniref:Amidohydrolase 3 domain-containing protein n=1 Tax=Ceratocystis pirilliformis TaxID=259994 RepID=A0ABR3YMS2_9PEZI
MHLLTTGQSMTKLSLVKCQNLEDIVATLKAYAAAHPEVPRILAGHWMHHMTGDRATAAALADVDPPKVASLSAALDAYCAAGYTGMIEMAMDEGGWEAALELRRQRGGVLPPNAEANKGGNAGRNRPRSRSPRPLASLAHAVTAATAGTAYSVFDENETGALKKDLRADIVVVDMQWEAHQLLQAKVLKTYSGGVLTFDAEAPR